MARRFRVSALAPAMPEVRTSDPGEISGLLCAFWARQLEELWPDEPRLIVLPEYCDRPRGLEGEAYVAYGCRRGSELEDFFADTARRHGTLLVYCTDRFSEDGWGENRMVFLDDGGRCLGTYTKVHLFPEEYRNERIRFGLEPRVVESPLGRLGGIICFDINFPVLMERYRPLAPEVMVFSSMFHGGLMQNIWAHGLSCHLVSAVSGMAGAILDPLGRVIAQSTNYRPFVTTDVNIDCAVVHVDYHEEKLRALRRRYGRAVTVDDLGLLGTMLLTSQEEGLPIGRVLEEFEITPYRQYLADSLAEREQAIARGRFSL